MTAVDLSRCAVLGAAGKMGRGIALIMLIPMAVSKAKNNGNNKYKLVLIDNDPDRLDTLREYFKTHLQRFAEKKINLLRSLYMERAELVSNRDIIDYFVNSALDIVHLSGSIEDARNVPFIFEAVIEDIDLKCRLFSSIDRISEKPPYYFSNTSSIPIKILNDKADLKGRIIGFHLYNPPAVQKLLEIIPLDNGDPQLYEIAIDIASQLEKIVVISKDVAGFIGNGHFIREISVASRMVRDLSETYPLPQAIYMINKVTGEFLLRPMGMFQLVDYVGLDVAEKVSDIMNNHLEKGIGDNSLVLPLITEGHQGGQFPDGSQKNGFFSYKDHKIHGIYDLKNQSYIPLEGSDVQKNGDEALGSFPEGHQSWNVLSKSPQAKDQIEHYLQNLFAGTTLGCKLASYFLEQSHFIIKQLVENNVAKSSKDVETVLKQGFYHLYAAI
jgi:3-hydroxyacyl-CoA dehydrogenase